MIDTSSSLNFLDLFAGGGGVACGLEQAGHHTSAAIEYDPEIAAVYAANHPHTKLYVSDIRDVRLTSLPCEITALWASPVCKQDSVARNRTLARREDAQIGEAIIPYIKAIQPELVIVENVPQYQYNPAFGKIVSVLSQMRYAISLRVLDAANYGIPQKRTRLILQARRGPIAWPAQTKERKSWFTALADIFDEMERSSLAPWQKALWRPEYDALRPCVVHGHYDYRSDHEPRALDVTPAWMPSRTVTASHNSTQRRIVFPDRILRMTPRGAARLQTFPDTYKLPERVILASAIVGNAVPPLLAQRITEQYREQQAFPGVVDYVKGGEVA